MRSGGGGTFSHSTRLQHSRAVRGVRETGEGEGGVGMNIVLLHHQSKPSSQLLSFHTGKTPAIVLEEISIKRGNSVNCLFNVRVRQSVDEVISLQQRKVRHPFFTEVKRRVDTEIRNELEGVSLSMNRLHTRVQIHQALDRDHNKVVIA